MKQKTQVPRYTYRCRECGVEFDTSHSIHDKLTYCKDCKAEDSLFRVVSDFNTIGLSSVTNKTEHKPGKVVNTKSDVEDYKDRITKNIDNMTDLDE